MILLIEDNIMIRENIKELLTLEKYDVITADSGLSGVGIAKTQKPDLIICDILMNGLDGYGVFKELKRNPETRGIPFIFSTSKSENSDKEKALALGIKYYLVKPYDVPELMKCVEDCLNNYT